MINEKINGQIIIEVGTPPSDEDGLDVALDMVSEVGEVEDWGSGWGVQFASGASGFTTYEQVMKWQKEAKAILQDKYQLVDADILVYVAIEIIPGKPWVEATFDETGEYLEYCLTSGLPPVVTNYAVPFSDIEILPVAPESLR